MAARKCVLKFPARLVDRPIASELVSEYGLVVNILRARVEPDEEGMLVVELAGDPGEIDAGLAHVKRLGVTVEPLSKDVAWRRELCNDCTACRNVCPTGALSISEETFEAGFDAGKCIACGSCTPACPYGAVEITF